MTASVRNPLHRRIDILLLAGALMAWAPAFAADPPEADGASSETAEADDAQPTQPTTGDPWIDARLDDVDRYAERHAPSLADELVRYHDAPRELVEDLLQRDGWRPGDVYFACALAQVAGRPCRAVVDAREQEDGADWEAVAGQVGVAPGSPQYKRLREALVASYRRWARPLGED